MNQQLTPTQIRLHQEHIRRMEANKRKAVREAGPAPIKVQAEPVEIEEVKPKPRPISSFTTSTSFVILANGYTGLYNDPTPLRTMHQIALSVLQQYPGITLERVKGREKNIKVMIPRFHVIWAIKTERPDISLPQIGRWMGGRDHTTILHSIKRYEEMLVERHINA